MLRKLVPALLLIGLLFSFGVSALAVDIEEVTPPPTPSPSIKPSVATVRVTFSAGGGKPLPASQTLSVGETITEPASPERAGYTFTGWYADSKKSVRFNFGTTVVNRMTLYAGWEKLPTVTFVAGGGKPAPKRDYILPGQTAVTLPLVTRAGYAFTEWYTDSKKTQIYNGGVGTDSGIKLYAGWKKLPAVTFNAKGGKPLPAKQSLNFGDLVTKPDEPVKKGSLFKGWYADAKFTVEFDFETTRVESSMKLYARFETLPVVTFSVSAATTKPEKLSVLPGSTIEPPAEITRPNYSFGGWYTSSRFTEEFDFSKPIFGKTTVYAKWIRNPVVTFMARGKTANPPKLTIVAGETIQPPVTGEPAGYTLEGWYTELTCRNKFDFSKPITEKLTLYANWVKT
ncbi:hypothetical protein FACS18949_02370 [Clostridia bacterium]|nr:hypothetical protein FACS18949_02370 [Clostridia bacterium]